MIDRFQPALFPKGTTPPFTPWAAEQFKKADTKVNDPNLACLPHGIPRIMFVPLPMEIFQVPDKVMMYQEAGNQLRQIHLNREHLKDLDPTYNGDSIGKWDGTTLVVDTIGFERDHVAGPRRPPAHGSPACSGAHPPRRSQYARGRFHDRRSQSVHKNMDGIANLHSKTRVGNCGICLRQQQIRVSRKVARAFQPAWFEALQAQNSAG